jgi:hypothetical protein
MPAAVCGNRFLHRFLYDWGLEVCSVRRKEFWPLFKARKLLEQFIPQLCHESDGLILQVGGEDCLCCLWQLVLAELGVCAACMCSIQAAHLRLGYS